MRRRSRPESAPSLGRVDESTRRPALPSRRLGRRALLGAVLGAAGALGAACRERDRASSRPTSSSASPTASARWLELRFPPSAARSNEQLALVLAERGKPLLVALHGRGESVRGLEAGARGWRDDYELERADRRLRSAPIEAADLLGLVREERLAALNASLGEHPYDGLCVACPFTPDLVDRSLEGTRSFARFLVGELLPRLHRELGVGAARSATGIDGVSLGGRYALLVGLSHPELFGSVGALQPAVREQESDELARLARSAQDRGLRHLRLVTSDEDYFRPAVEALSAALGRHEVRHELLVTPGPHDYAYNRGPGSFEMLLWHERVLRALPPP